jgi:hypothetical protein
MQSVKTHNNKICNIINIIYYNIESQTQNKIQQYKLTATKAETTTMNAGSSLAH